MALDHEYALNSLILCCQDIRKNAIVSQLVAILTNKADCQLSGARDEFGAHLRSLLTNPINNPSKKRMNAPVSTSLTAALSGLGHLLVQRGLMSLEAVHQASHDAKARGITLVHHLVREGLLDAQTLAAIQSQAQNTPIEDPLVMDASFVDIGCDETLFIKHRVLPMRADASSVHLAMSDLYDTEAISTIRFHAQRRIVPILVQDDKLSVVLDSLYLGNDMQFDEVEEVEPTSDASAAEDAPVVRFVQKLLIDAIRLKASDIHFEPYEYQYRIRFRIDGMMQVMHTPPVGLAIKVASYLKVLAHLDIAERRRAQDGRIKFPTADGHAVDFRVSTLPTLYGEKIVLRLLDSQHALIGLDALGMTAVQKQQFLEALARPQGMILVTGPTGSGKTVTLYTALSLLNQPEVNILSCEDPVEINVEGINQVNINPKVQLDFADALRAFLRQDPDVIMVGEIRDADTAKIATAAAQTGHLLLSTLHTTSASETITRLHSMGVPSFHLSGSLTLIIAQRLARRLCDDCKQPIKMPADALLEAGFDRDDIQDGMVLFEAAGCPKCKNGHRGRVGIFECLPITADIAALILSGASATDIDQKNRALGNDSLRQAGIKKVLSGDISLSEMHRVISQ